METRIIARVNNVDIVSTSDEQLVPIRPICEALGIDAKVQRTKIQEDEDLSSVGVLSTSTGADGKRYEMYCLPKKYICGWLLTINPKNVKEEAKEAVRKYRMECFNILHNHFFGQQERQIIQNQKEIALLEDLANYTQQKDSINRNIAETKKKLEKLRAERLSNEPTLFS